MQASSHLLRNLFLLHWPLDARFAHQLSPFELEHGAAVGAAVGEAVGESVGEVVGAAVQSTHSGTTA